jgi:hypothetical protein
LIDTGVERLWKGGSKTLEFQSTFLHIKDTHKNPAGKKIVKFHVDNNHDFLHSLSDKMG